MEEIREQLEKTIKSLYDIDFKADLSVAPENIDADYSSNAPLKLEVDVHQELLQLHE